MLLNGIALTGEGMQTVQTSYPTKGRWPMPSIGLRTGSRCSSSTAPQVRGSSELADDVAALADVLEINKFALASGRVSLFRVIAFMDADKLAGSSRSSVPMEK